MLLLLDVVSDQNLELRMDEVLLQVVSENLSSPLITSTLLLIVPPMRSESTTMETGTLLTAERVPDLLGLCWIVSRAVVLGTLLTDELRVPVILLLDWPLTDPALLLTLRTVPGVELRLLGMKPVVRLAEVVETLLTGLLPLKLLVVRILRPVLTVEALLLALLTDDMLVAIRIR